jgi:signal transduction histidine kinase
MFMFAVALAVFAYATLTRLIVGPVESLAHAADRVAEGERTLRVPRAGARELAELGRSLQAMTTRLVADEEAMRAKVAELTRTTQRLEETKRHLARSERLASVGRLAAGIAHEIGNPLAALLGFEDLLLDGDLPLETQRDFLVRMKRETERMHTVVRGLLDFARPEKSTGADSLATADVAAVIGDVVALAGPQKLFRNVELAVELDVGPLVVAMSSASLTQVVLNLVLNAGAALEQRMEGRVVLRARGDSQEVRLEVEDNGPGVSAELRDRLFEPFATTKDVGEGTGLGLAVCRGLVEGAGGTIDLDTSYSGGARFCVVVRRCRSRTPHCSAPSP